jgi:predicted site-specific integrase-resolvase
MKAKDVLKKYDITRRTLTNWVKRGIIQVEKTPSGRYIYFEKVIKKNDENL